MADVDGSDGDVTLAAGNGEAKGWSIKFTQRKKDTSRFGGTRFAKQRGGLIDVSGSVNVFLQQGTGAVAPGVGGATPAALDPDGVSLTLTAMTGCTFTGDAVLDFSMNAAMDDPALEATYDFTGNGDWSEAWATGA